MADEPGAARPLVLPQLHYEDPKAAVTWLCEVFGFVEESRMSGPDGTFYLADLRGPNGGVVLVSGLGEPVKQRMRTVLGDDFQEGRDASWPNLSYSITVLVGDVDAHFKRARNRGARVIAEPVDQPWGLRDYEVLDLEGRQWNFSQHLRVTNPEEWGATAATRSASDPRT